MYRAAIVGLGRTGSTYDLEDHGGPPRSHAGAYRACPRAELVAVADVDPERRRAFGDAWGFGGAVHRSVEELLASNDVDVLSVCTPAATHASVVTAALARPPRLILCEKPATASPDEARLIAERAERAKVPIAVNYHRSWDPGHQRFLAALAREGKPAYALGRYGRGLLNYGSHMVHLLATVLGRVEAVQAHAGGPSGTRYGDTADPSLSFTLRCAGPATAHVVGMDGLSYDLFEADFYLTDAVFELHKGGRVKRVRRSCRDVVYAGYAHLGDNPAPDREEPVGGLLEAVENIVAHLDDPRTPLRCSIAEAVEVQEVLDLIRRSVREGGRMLVRETHAWS